MAEIRVSATGELKLYDSDDSNYVSFKSGGTVSSNVTWTLPTADGSNGQVLTTDGSGALSWATASSADPSSADGDSLGTASAEWSDLYLADGGIVYFGNDQEITLTHSADSGLLLKHTATADDKPINLVLQTGETDMAANDVIGKISFQAPDEGTGTDAILVSAAIQAVAEGDHSSSSNATRIEFMVGASEAAAKKMQLTSAGKLEVDGGIDIEGGAVFNEDSADVDFRVESNGNANAFIVDASTDRVGFGIAAPETEMHIKSTSGDCELRLTAADTSDARLRFGDTTDTDLGYIGYSRANAKIYFAANAGNGAVFEATGDGDIRSNGWVGNGSGQGWKLNRDSNQGQFILETHLTTTRDMQQFVNGNGTVGGIQTSGSSTSYVTSSDYRLKENETPIVDGITRLKQLKPYRFNFKADANTTVDGFFAHEVSSVVPEAITGEKDAMKKEPYIIEPAVLDENKMIVKEAVMGEREVISMQGIDQAKLVPLLTSALKEAITKIETLETKVTALEG